MQVHRLVHGLLGLFLSVCLLGCGSSGDSPPASIGDNPGTPSVAADGAAAPGAEPVQVRATEASHPLAAPSRSALPAPPEVEIKTGLGSIRIRLNVEKAPVTVDNFLANYVERGFYDQTVFHYVDKGFMIAGGGYTADLQPKPARAYIRNEAANGLKNVRGTVAMARPPEHADSATSQFFINLADNPGLDFKDTTSGENYGYCVFGEVVAGMDVVDQIADTPVVDKDQFPKTPATPVVIESVRRLQ